MHCLPALALFALPVLFLALCTFLALPDLAGLMLALQKIVACKQHRAHVSESCVSAVKALHRSLSALPVNA